MEQNARRGLQGKDYELIDTGDIDGDCYRDALVEYIKASREDIFAQVTSHS